MRSRLSYARQSESKEDNDFCVVSRVCRFRDDWENTVVTMTSNRTVVASLVCLSVFCQHYWTTIGHVLQSTWLKIIQVCGDDDNNLYFYGISVKIDLFSNNRILMLFVQLFVKKINSGVAIGINVFYWIVAFIFLFMDITNRPKWMRQFKVQPGTNEPVNMIRLRAVLMTL